MKKIMITLTLMISALVVDAQRDSYSPGWITINLNDFMCNTATTDDVLNFDGFGDEVYFVVFYSVSNQFGITKYSNKVVSKVYGDTYRFPDRILAGNANPEKKGGMSSGSQFFPGNGFPNLQRIRVEAGDFITVIPTIWEWDNVNSRQLQSSFDSRMLNSFNVINLKMKDLIKDCYGYYNCYRINNYQAIDMPSFADLLLPMVNTVGSRPIGISATGDYSPIVFGINSQMIKSQNNSGYSNGINYSMNYVSFDINEQQLGKTTDYGIYRLRYHMMFEQDNSLPASSPTPANTGAPIKTKVITRPATLGGNNTLQVISNPLSGYWEGEQTTSSGLYPQKIAFELTNKGELIMRAQDGTVAAQGTYSLSNNYITGSYKQFSSGETFKFYGTYNAAQNALNCSLGINPDVSGQGIWKLSKK